MRKVNPMNDELKKKYYEGLREGVWRFAWMKDGVYYVGTTGKTLKQALKEIDLEEKGA